MLIVDAQVHIWSAGPPTNPSHRQVNSYSAEECIRDMDAAGVNACLLHPPGWDPNSGKISEEAASKYPNRFGILGNFPLDKPENRALIDSWKKRPGMLGLRYAFTQLYGAGHGRILIKTVVDIMIRQFHQLWRAVEIREALRKINGVVFAGQGAHGGEDGSTYRRQF